MKNKEILRKLRSVELCMTAHPDCEKGSEFEDRIIDLQEIQQALILPDVSKCVFCDNQPYKKGASYCEEHMKANDWS